MGSPFGTVNNCWYLTHPVGMVSAIWSSHADLLNCSASLVSVNTPLRSENFPFRNPLLDAGKSNCRSLIEENTPLASISKRIALTILLKVMGTWLAAFGSLLVVITPVAYRKSLSSSFVVLTFRIGDSTVGWGKK